MGPRIAIVGSRDWQDLARVRRFVHSIQAKYPEAVIVSGGARGVDTAAVEEAERIGLDSKIWPADWNKHGRSAGFKRNRQIVADAEIVVAFQYNESKGTAHTIRLARDMGRLTFVYKESS